jgi:hypothetical protein
MNRRLSVDSDALAAFCRRHHIARLALVGSVLTDNFRPDSGVGVPTEFLPGHVPGLRFVTPRFLNPLFRNRVLSTAEPVYDAAA